MKQPYTNDFYAALRDGVLRSARAVVPLVLQLVPARSVVDVGCGTGTWLSVFSDCGVEHIWGVDGDYIDRDRLEISRKLFQPHDLTRPVELDQTFDLAVSLEVAEHLPADVAEVFVGSLARLAPVVLFSAAAPYQGGERHVNEQWPAYWAERFARHGFLPVDCLRRRLWGNAEVEWWYSQNTFLFVERARLERDAALRREYEVAGPHALPLVHPRRYLEWIEWGLNLCGGESSPETKEAATE
jgi:SAM-dependent methyltransferase